MQKRRSHHVHPINMAGILWSAAGRALEVNLPLPSSICARGWFHYSLEQEESEAHVLESGRGALGLDLPGVQTPVHCRPYWRVVICCRRRLSRSAVFYYWGTRQRVPCRASPNNQSIVISGPNRTIPAGWPAMHCRRPLQLPWRPLIKLMDVA